MAKMVIKRVEVFPVAKWTGIHMAIVFLSSVVIFSLFFGFVVATGFLQAPLDKVLAEAARPPGFIRLVITLFFLNGTVGFVAGFVRAIIYNAFAGKSLPAIEVEMDTVPNYYR